MYIYIYIYIYRKSNCTSETSQSSRRRVLSNKELSALLNNLEGGEL